MPEATVPEFRRALLARFRQAEEAGKRHLEVACRDLHDEVNSDGNKPAVCSGVMWVETSEGNCEIVSTPPGGAGRSLTIRYGLPRRPSRFAG